MRTVACLTNSSDSQGALISFTSLLHCGICKSTAKGPGYYPWRTPVSARNVHQYKSGRNNRVTICANFYLHFHSIQACPSTSGFGRRRLQNSFICREGTKQGCDVVDAKFTEQGLNYSHRSTLILAERGVISDSLPSH